MFWRYNFFRKLLYVLGTPGIKFRYENKFLVIMHTFSFTVMLALSVLMLVIHAVTAYKCNSEFVCLKKSAIMIVYQLCLVSIWCTFHLNKFYMQNLMKHIQICEKRREMKNYRFIMNTTTFLALLGYVIIIGKAIQSLCNDSNLRNHWFKDITLGLIPNIGYLYEISVVATYIVMTRIYFKLMPILLSVFYALWSFYLSLMVKSCQQRLSASLCDSNLRNVVMQFIINYQKIYQLVILTEQALSAQVFWIITEQFIQTFFSLSQFLGFSKGFDSVFVAENTAFHCLQTISFFTITVLASKVKENDEAFRIEVRELAFQLSLSKETHEFGKTLIRFIDSKPPLVLTAWGIFRFTKSFLFTSVGTLITYNLLLLQIEIKT